MSKFGLGFLALGAISAHAGSPDPLPANYRGFIAYEQAMQTRVGRDDARLDLGRYLDAAKIGGNRAILGLLGTYSTGRITIQNGDPNALNFLLWGSLVGAWVEDQLSLCNDPAAPVAATLDPDWAALVREACLAAAPLTEALIADTVERIASIRASDEGKEGVKSFLEKRKPQWLAE